MGLVYDKRRGHLRWSDNLLCRYQNFCGGRHRPQRVGSHHREHPACGGRQCAQPGGEGVLGRAAGAMLEESGPGSDGEENPPRKSPHQQAFFQASGFSQAPPPPQHPPPATSTLPPQQRKKRIRSTLSRAEAAQLYDFPRAAPAATARTTGPSWIMSCSSLRARRNRVRMAPSYCRSASRTVRAVPGLSIAFCSRSWTWH